MPEILVLGVGPGSSSFLSPVVIEKARSCDVLFGGKRNLELFNALLQEKHEIKGDVSSLVQFIAANYENKKVGILVSGDPGLFSLLKTLKRYFSSESIEVVPAVSALQYFFARLTLTWEDAVIISLHGKERKDLADLLRNNPKAGIFTDSKNNPSSVCQLLLEKGVTNKMVYIGENLSYPTERILRGEPRELVNIDVSELNVMVIVDKDV